MKHYLNSIKKGKALLPELFSDKIFELYGNDVPYVLICPMGIRLNQRMYDKNRNVRVEVQDIERLEISGQK